MNEFDAATTLFFNQFARKSFVFDQAVAFLSVNMLLKGGVLMTLVWWAWFRTSSPNEREREHILATLFSAGVALAIGRIMVLTLPFRERPLHEASLQFILPHGVATGALDGLSSFPSDHATLFFGLAAGLFFVSLRMGLFALAYVTIFIALPRLYLGLHYATDILAGAAIGVTCCVVGNYTLQGRWAVQAVKRLSFSAPAYFYPLLFLVTYQIADLFEGVRDLLGGVAKAGLRFASG